MPSPDIERAVSAAKEISQAEWVWHGFAGHFICGSKCRFHLCTEVGDFLVSTVGEYYLDSKAKKPEDLGYPEGSVYETLVFRLSSARCVDPECACDARTVEDWSELEGRRHKLRGEATKAHMDACRRYAALARTEAK